MTAAVHQFKFANGNVQSQSDGRNAIDSTGVQLRMQRKHAVGCTTLRLKGGMHACQVPFDMARAREHEPVTDAVRTDDHSM